MTAADPDGRSGRWRFLSRAPQATAPSMLRLRTCLLGLLAFLAASPAAAWWEYGHETVAAIARLAVRPETRAAIDQLLAREKLLATPTCPARTIEQASVWADCVKPLGDRFSYFYSWHYQNVDVCKPFDLEAACKDDHCVSAQIERTARMLADKRLPTRDRVEALALLIHFVGDLHMPLHAGDRADLGGNRAKVGYGVLNRRPNLHAVWDGLLADRAISTPPGGARGIFSTASPKLLSTARAGSVADWSRENWQVARDAGYAAIYGEPCGPKDEAVRTMDEATTRRLIPVLREQVLRGGLRLAQLLDEALGGAAPDPSRQPRPRRS